MSGRLDRKVAIVTGGANGIGRAICELFAREGARVVVVDRDEREGESVVQAITNGGGEGIFVVADVSQESDVASVVTAAVNRYGHPTVLVNCAGIALGGTVTQTDPARWQRVIDVNLAAAYLTCRLTIPHMIEAGGGSIVNVASLQGMYGYPGWAAYAASKAGLIGLTRQTAVDYAVQNIRCNAISPGAILTQLGANTAKVEPRFFTGAESDIDAEKTESVPKPVMLRPGRPEDVAYATLFLASDESRHITGHNLVVDGGASSRVE